MSAAERARAVPIRERTPLERIAVAARIIRVASRIVLTETGEAIDAGASADELALALGLTSRDRGDYVEAALDSLRGWA